MIEVLGTALMALVIAVFFLALFVFLYVLSTSNRDTYEDEFTSGDDREQAKHESDD